MFARFASPTDDVREEEEVPLRFFFGPASADFAFSAALAFTRNALDTETAHSGTPIGLFKDDLAMCFGSCSTSSTVFESLFDSPSATYNPQTLLRLKRRRLTGWECRSRVIDLHCFGLEPTNIGTGSSRYAAQQDAESRT